MIERLALPAWQSPPRTLDDWVARLSAEAGPVAVIRESAGVSWIEIGALRLRGYVVIEGERVEAINFELAAPEPEAALQVIESAARDLGWEVHVDDEPDDETDED